MRRFHVRNAILKDLKQKGLYVESNDNDMQIPICSYAIILLTSPSLTIHSRSGDVIEQVLKPQWWISCKPMAEEVLKVSSVRIQVKG